VAKVDTTSVLDSVKVLARLSQKAQSWRAK